MKKLLGSLVVLVLGCLVVLALAVLFGPSMEKTHGQCLTKAQFDALHCTAAQVEAGGQNNPCDPQGPEVVGPGGVPDDQNPGEPPITEGEGCYDGRGDDPTNG